MRNILVLFVTMIPFGLMSQATLGWIQPTGGLSVAVDSQQNVYTVNYEYNPGGDIHLTKRDANGVFQWEAVYDNTDPTKFESATWVETDQAGNIIVTGTVNSGYSNPVKANSIVMKYNPSGNLLWRQVYETYFDGSWTKKCVTDSDNNIYVLGMGSGPNGFVTKVKKFSPDGTALWSYFDADGIGAPVNIKLTPDQKLLLIGRGTVGSLNGYAKIDLSGNELWSMGGVYSTTVGDAAGDLSGNTYIVHQDYYGNSGTLVKKLSPAGSVIWTSSSPISGFRIEVGNDQQAVISGFPSGGGAGTAFVKFSETGSVLWTNPDADGSLNLLMHAQMKMDAQDNAYLAAGTLFEMAICKVNSNGSSAWTFTCSGSYANAFGIGNDNTVYVVGGTTARINQEQPATRVLNLQLLLQSLYAGNGLMNKASNGSGSQFQGTVADQVTVELHNPSNYQSIEFQFEGVNLYEDGSCTINLPPAANASYYITVKHRNSLETTSAQAVSFSGTVISYAFDQASKAFGGNLAVSADNHRMIFSGDITQDNLVDSSDMIEVDNQVSSFSTGYLPADLNGDGIVDASDMIIVDNNAEQMTGSVLPQ